MSSDRTSSEWLAYLTLVGGKSAHGAALGKVWRALDSAVADLPLPRASVSDSVSEIIDPAYLSWDRDEHHFDLEIEPSGYEWFYRNRKTDEIDGSDGAIALDHIPEAMLTRLRLIPEEQRT